MRTKQIFLGLLFTMFLALGTSDAQAQYVDLQGNWKSTSGASFFVLTNGEGFKYQNMSDKKWYYANWQNDYDHNKYEAPNFTKAGSSVKYSIYFTVKNNNTISVYNSGTGSTITWTRIQ